MLTASDFNARCDRLFDNMLGRFRARYWASGKRKGKVRVPARELDFDRYDMRRFMAAQIGLCAQACPYCGAPIDILSLTLDHVVPVARGGSLGFENLQAICADCNVCKGKLTGEEFTALLAFLKPLHPAAQSDIRARLKGSAKHFDSKRKNRVEEAA